MTSNIEYWCSCGAGAVGTTDELLLIDEWVTGHGKECEGSQVQEPEDFPFPAACNRCGYESKHGDYESRGWDVRQHMIECEEREG